MNDDSVKSLISLQRMNNQFLSMVDSIKSTPNEEVSVAALLKHFYTPYNEVEVDYSSGHSFYNQYQLISSLYTYIVLPKERFFSSIPERLKTNDLQPAWGLVALPDMPMKYFLRRMRNSIAHGNVDFNEQLDFVFTDKNPKKPSDNFEVTISCDNLHKFVQALAYWYITQDIELTGIS